MTVVFASVHDDSFGLVVVVVAGTVVVVAGEVVVVGFVVVANTGALVETVVAVAEVLVELQAVPTTTTARRPQASIHLLTGPSVTAAL
ncbi:MAG: hypothetical protein KGQ66_04625 [Acidobacteriota bacterium]|nr:hypothetical protein [Acidobacteriota bacterium]